MHQRKSSAAKVLKNTLRPIDSALDIFFNQTLGPPQTRWVNGKMAMAGLRMKKCATIRALSTINATSFVSRQQKQSEDANIENGDVV